MQALYYSVFGPKEVLQYGEKPDPQPGPGEILVAVKAASVNPLDWKIRNGDMKVLSGSSFPKIIGTDFAGSVKALGPKVAGLKVGDAVYGAAASFGRKPGSCAGLLAVAAAQARLLPKTLNFIQAAALPVSALTALNGLRRCGELKGKRVAVIGATGGVGHFAVQIAKARGAQVTGICRESNHDLAKKLGADTVIDYRKADFTRAGQQYDVILDTHAHLGFPHFKPALAAHGYYAVTLPSLSLFTRIMLQTLTGGPKAVSANLRAWPQDYAELEGLIQSGAVKPLIEHQFTLEQGRQAFELAESGNSRGKIVIEIG